MNHSEIIVLIVSFLAIVISLFTIWLAMMFYRLYSQWSLLVIEMSKGLEMSTARLEKIPALLYEKKVFIPEKQEHNPEPNNNLHKEEK
ncbi:MAG: hypothetical protein ACOC6D_07870 [Atribacterota bacterium]